MDSVRLISPFGTAVYPWLNDPDTRFEPEGVYACTLRLSAEDAEPFVKQLETIHKQAYSYHCKDQKKKQLKTADLPVKPVVDDDTGEETGEFEVKFKLPAKVTTKTGKSWEQRPKLFDSANKPVEDRVGGGSTIRISAEVRPWFVPTMGVGLTLRMKAVQVQELKSPSSGGDSASDHGFDEVEGFKAQTFESSSESNDDFDF